ncbi:hypothetical protein GWI33_014011 [Rhynchophorus ferrugineus]|uniref:Uncharacterized protein n=1 Tax=Rhynchophorus ferrugineus TaxID=354439 RepID=A0A834I5Y4_RHYFE|nr:hypothetical protein GWI33_014011 [Rhynchophorus ferrugineus]
MEVSGGKANVIYRRRCRWHPAGEPNSFGLYPIGAADTTTVHKALINIPFPLRAKIITQKRADPNPSNKNAKRPGGVSFPKASLSLRNN